MFESDWKGFGWFLGGCIFCCVMVGAVIGYALGYNHITLNSIKFEVKPDTPPPPPTSGVTLPMVKGAMKIK